MEDYTCIEEIKIRSRPNQSVLNSFQYAENYETKPNFIQLRTMSIDYSYYKYFDFSEISALLNIFNRPFLKLGLFDLSSLFTSMITNFDIRPDSD